METGRMCVRVWDLLSLLNAKAITDHVIYEPQMLFGLQDTRLQHGFLPTKLAIIILKAIFYRRNKGISNSTIYIFGIRCASKSG